MSGLWENIRINEIVENHYPIQQKGRGARSCILTCDPNFFEPYKMIRKFMSRVTSIIAFYCLIVIIQAMAPGGAFASEEKKGSKAEMFFPIDNMSVPILQNGKSKGTLLFNLLIEMQRPGERPLMLRYAPKLTAVFFEELYTYASTLKEDKKVRLRKIKAMLTIAAKKVAGDERVKQVLVKDYYRTFN